MTRDAGEIRDEVDEFGVGLGLIDENLRLPVAERMLRHFERVRTYQRMQERTLMQNERLLEVLAESGVSFVVIGGVAAIALCSTSDWTSAFLIQSAHEH